MNGSERKIHRPEVADQRQLGENALIKQAVATCRTRCGLQQAFIAIEASGFHRHARTLRHCTDLETLNGRNRTRQLLDSPPTGDCIVGGL